jgi:hypothetical protein
MPTPAVISAFINAVNAGDTEAFLALFEEHGVVDDWGTRYIGHKQIRTWSDRELIGVEARLKITSSEEHQNEASVNVEVGGTGFNGPSRFAFTMEGSLVKEMRITGE